MFFVVSVAILLFLNSHKITCQICTFSSLILGAWDHKLNYDAQSFITEMKITNKVPLQSCPVGRNRRIHRLLFCRQVRSPSKYPSNDNKQSDGEILVIQELWEMKSISSLPSLPGQLWPR